MRSNQYKDGKCGGVVADNDNYSATIPKAPEELTAASSS
jgi:hypothetical protein